MSDQSERLARMEGKLEIFQSLLQEIRDDIKGQPSKDDLLVLKERIDKNESNLKEMDGIQDAIKLKQNSLSLKVALMLTAATTIISLIVRAILRSMGN